MRILVTGGTGLVGLHTALVAIDAGHDVRLLVRDRSKLERIFGDLARPVPDHVVGDTGDVSAVERALEGCDGVVHAAAMVVLEAKHAKQVLEQNVRGVELVVGGAWSRRIPRIVYVSSVGALFQPGGPPVSVDSPVVAGKTAYARSKADAEHYVRGLQDEGAPIRTVYPGGVLAPDDPGLNETNHALRTWVRDIVLHTEGGFPLVDGRDLAVLHLRLLEADLGAQRCIFGGRFIPWRELGDLIDEVTGVKVRRLPIPGAALRFGGRIGDFVKRFWEFDFPITSETIAFATQFLGAENSQLVSDLGVTCRAPRETLADSLRWLHRAGHVDAKYVGRLAKPAASSAEGETASC